MLQTVLSERKNNEMKTYVQNGEVQSDKDEVNDEMSDEMSEGMLK